MATYESSQISTLTDSIKSFGILKNPQNDIYTLTQTKVFIYKRKNDSFIPQLHVWYHFDLDNKAIKGIRYNWGLLNPSFNPSKEESLLKDLTTHEKEFIEKYNSLESELRDKFGKPIKTNTIVDNTDKLIKEIFWEDNQKIVGLSIRFTRKIKRVDMADFEIVVMVTYK